MKRKPVVHGTLIALLVAGVVTAGTTAASAAALPHAKAAADQAKSQDEHLQQLDKFWARYGVSAGKRGELTNKIKAGKVLDSSTKKAPSRSVEQDSGAFHQVIDTYADGSIRVAEVQIKPGVIADPGDVASGAGVTGGHLGRGTPTADYTNCSYQSGSGYSNATNCLVRGTTGEITNWFYADFTLVQGSYNDQLTATRNPGQTCIWPWSCSVPSRSQYVKQETTYTKAGATYTGTRNAPFASGTQYLNLEVGNNSARAWFTVP